MPPKIAPSATLPQKYPVPPQVRAPPSTADLEFAHLQRELDHLKVLHDTRRITDEEYAAMRMKTLGITPPPVFKPTSIECESESSRRELASILMRWIGTADRPFVGDSLCDQLELSSQEGLRMMLNHLTTATRFDREMRAIFSTRGTTPELLIGDSATHVFARKAARQWLMRLAAAMVVYTTNSDTSLSVKDYMNLQREAELCITDDDANVQVLLRSLRVHRSAKHSAKREREEQLEGNSIFQRVRRDVNARSHAPLSRKIRSAGYEGVGVTPETRAKNRQTGKCDECGGIGHIRRDCPSMTKKKPQGGKKSD
ncbi:Hypothetical protein, putative [Bodo saltans]|uniref:CCHC-type domain-containing protein n=1 Tax=Bodo saltans TaxID=75058 RepID=A0A0S4IP39_BODSA|nr:Hypothetical protein, putative [Bodo saltans]|eukprot:CUF79443.1 Hypothetical protein, putative [Bodo saltans]